MATQTLPTQIEWRTLAVILTCYGLWGTAFIVWDAAPSVAFTVLVLTIALQSSLQHEVLHGHPTPWATVNTLLALPSLNLAIPYFRFRDTHLAHHRDEALTDPYDDPESNFMDPSVWASLPRWCRGLLRVNNTLAGRMVLGPLIGQITFMAADLRQYSAKIAWAWGVQAGVVGAICMLIWATSVPFWAYGLAAYCGLSLLKVRTFLEHRAHTLPRARTVIIEDRGPLAFLFLNNNLHVVHHAHPCVPWYDLPGLYAARRMAFQKRNEAYVYRSYGQVFRAYLWRTKDPVPHPLRPQVSPVEDPAAQIAFTPR